MVVSYVPLIDDYEYRFWDDETETYYKHPLSQSGVRKFVSILPVNISDQPTYTFIDIPFFKICFDREAHDESLWCLSVNEEKFDDFYKQWFCDREFWIVRPLDEFCKLRSQLVGVYENIEHLYQQRYRERQARTLV